MAELVIVTAIIGIVSAFAVVQIRTSRAALRVQNSVRQLASFMEKARVDAVRRHATSTVSFTDTRTYSVTMDFNNGGSTSTRTFTFQEGVQLASSELPNVTFNWRGRTLTAGSSCITTFSVSDTIGNGLSVDVSGSGDVTVENQQPDLPNVVYSNVNSSDGVDSRAIVGGTSTTDNTPCMDLSGGGVAGDSGPPSCTIHVSSTSISIKKNGGTTGSVLVSMSNPSLVVASYPSNLTLSPVSQSVSSTGSNFSVSSKNTLRGPFNVTFTSQCGSSITVKVNVTN
jgi:Tfp pilus assembly protein FimT